jgi:formylglycine-generating enzyme required for sulfatase activity
MCKSLGEENAILHNFLRTVLVGGTVCGLAAAGWMWPQLWQMLTEATAAPTLDASLRTDRTAEPPAEENSEASTVAEAPSNVPPATQLLKPAAAAGLQNSLGMLLVPIPAGEFSMGSPTTESGRIGTEQPHVVQISQAFFLSAHEVTQGQFAQVMGSNPSHFSSQKRGALLAGVDVLRLPVDSVLWSEAAEFCRRLTARPEEQAARRSYRLPTDAEWEYACRAGSTTPYACGASLSISDANFKAPALNSMLLRPMVVGSYPANAFGLFDMHGNVEEWCGDYYDYGYYRTSPQIDPRGPAAGINRVARGGSYLDSAEECRSARRTGRYPGSRVVMSGFRVACDVPK